MDRGVKLDNDSAGRERNLAIKNGLIALATEVRKAVSENSNNKQKILKRKFGGDPHFEIDEIAEQTVENFLKNWELPFACFSEDRGLVYFHEKPEHLFIIDPIDGTRSAIADFESCCFSAVVAPYSKKPKFFEITNALVFELKTGEYFYADSNQDKITASAPELPLLTKKTNPENMFWSTELTAHPIKQIARVCGDLIDNSVALGAVFVFTSSSYSLTRIVTGQLDAHVDVGHRILRENPALEEEFLKAGRGKIVTLFPYDIAAAAFILQKAGGIVTDAYGNSLDELCLTTDKSANEQCSIVAASNQELHEKIMNQLKW
jgi:myo-inositol-1(or 4)-monophosphatase